MVPLRCEVMEQEGSLALRIPRYAAEVFEANPAVRVRVGRDEWSGVVDAANDRGWVSLHARLLETLGLGVGNSVEVHLRADP